MRILPRLVCITLVFGLSSTLRDDGVALAWQSHHWGGHQLLDLMDEEPPAPPALYLGPWDLKAKPHNLFKRAEKEFKKKNFRRAERGYARFIKNNPKHIDVPQATYQRARALFKLASYDQALKLLSDFLASRPGLIWEARCRQVLAEITIAMPYWGFRRGKKVIYNQEHREGQRVYLWSYNRYREVRELETARLAFLEVMKADEASVGARPDEDVFAEAIENHLHLAKVLSAGGRVWDGTTPETDISPPEEGAEYDFSWAERTKVIFLFEEAERLSLGAERKKLAAEARFSKAVFLMSFPEAAPLSFLKESQERLDKCNQARKNGDPICQQPFYRHAPRLDPLSLVESIFKDFPENPNLDRALGAKARILEGQGDFLAAESTYERLIEEFPESKYVGDAKSSLFQLRRAWFNVYSDATFTPEKAKELTISARNLSAISFKAYQVDLQKALGSPAALSDPRRHFAEFTQNFGDAKQARKWFGRRVASWTYLPNDRKDHVQTQGTTSVPIEEPGAYLVLAEGGKEQNVTLVVLTDLVMLGKQDRGRVHYWVTDSKTGSPVPGVSLIVKETYWLNNAERVRIGRYQSDSDGRITHQLVKTRYASTSNVQVLGHKDKHQVFTRNQYCYSRGSQQKYDQNRIFTITDRPVYRPGDSVRFKHIVRGYHLGKNENLPGVRVRVWLYGPRGEKLYDHTSKTDDYGSIHGEVKLPKEAPLGVYRLSAQVEKGYGSYQSSGSTFRVEEYKKPEFEVTVTPATPDTRFGKPVKAEISARYYFGAPVAHAKVSYQIYREPYWHVYYPPSRYDWLYGSGYGLVYERPFQQGVGQEFVKQAEGQTDEKGILRLELPAADPESKIDFRYTIQAQVTDLSRRTINGKGEVKVTKNPFSIFVNTQHGFYSPGDRIELEVNARTPQDRPVQARGSWTVFRMRYPIGEKEVPEKLASHPLKTGPAGRAFVNWKALDPGQYRISVALRQGDGPLVEHECYLYVTGDQFDPGRFKFQKITLKTDKRTYLRGETIRLMIGAPRPGATLWLSHEGADEIFEDRVIRLAGTGKVMEFRADEIRAPNFFVRLVMVDKGQAYFAQHEVFIPPGEEILEVTLAPDSASHRPRDKGKFNVTVKDHQGRPVKGQLCLSVFDQSVLYIQGDTSGDIRPYYYGERRYLQLWVDNSLQIWHLGAHWSPKPPKFKLGGLPGAGQAWSTISLSGVGLGGGGYGYFGGRYRSLDFDGQVVRDQAVLLSSNASAVPAGDHTTIVTEPIGKLSAGEDISGRLESYNGKARGPGSGPGAPGPMVREFFADTALWIPDVETDEHGKATVDIEYPDSVTTWKGRLFVIDKGRKVGMAVTSVVTTKKLIARIETPRFLVEGDNLTLAAVIRNDYDHPLHVQVRLHLEGLQNGSSPELKLTIPAKSDMRHDFSARAGRAGTAKVRLTVLSAKESDALQKTLPVMEWGSDKMVAVADTLKKPGEVKLALELPKDRKPGSARLTIEAAPSMGAVLLRALPYLLEYPYGCIEQTISRFVPAAVVARTLKDAGVSLEQLKPVRGQADIARHLGKLPYFSAIRSSKELDNLIHLYLKRIASFQNPDGGFGWFSGFDSDSYMTAYAVIGLWEAKQAGYPVDASMIQRAVDFLHSKLEDLKPNHLGVLAAYAAGLHDRPMPDLLGKAYRRRDKLSPYGQSILALALWRAGSKSRARLVVENLADLAWVDKANATATFKPPPARWWLWWFNRVETTAWALRAFMQIDPEHPQVDRFAKWLVNNRSGNRWTNTRDTATAVLALTQYMRHRGELNPDSRIAIWVNDRKVREFSATKKSVLGLEATVVLPDEALASGAMNIRVILEGRGVVYASAFLEYFSKEQFITGAGHEIGVERSYSKLTPVVKDTKNWRGKIKVRDYRKERLTDGATIKSGDVIEVRLKVESLNDYSYLVFEDFKPAGFEPLELKSGCGFEHGAWVYRELRDEKVVHFLNLLPQGSQVMTYRLRAEIPGTFRILPHKAHAMYAPRIRAISDSGTLSVSD